MNVLASSKSGNTIGFRGRDIAGALQVEQGPVSRYLKIKDLHSEPFVKGRPPIIAQDVEEWIVKEVMDRVTCTQSELARDASELFNITISQQSSSLILANTDVKKIQVEAEEQSEKLERHVKFHEQLVDVPATHWQWMRLLS
jgi:hypothetical protein